MAGVALGGTTGVVLGATKAVPCGVVVGEGGAREAVAAGGTGVCVGVWVDVGTCVGTLVADGVSVGVSVGVAVGVGVCVGHAVSVGTGVGQVFVTCMGTTCKTLLSTSPVPPTSLTAALR